MLWIARDKEEAGGGVYLFGSKPSMSQTDGYWLSSGGERSSVRVELSFMDPPLEPGEGPRRITTIHTHHRKAGR